jgi:hypothetical protein
MKSIRLLQIFAACPCGGAAGGNDVGCHGTDVFGSVRHRTRLPADHEGQGPGLRTAHAARDRGVHEAEAGGSSGVVQCLRGSDVNGGGVHQQRAGIGMGQDTVLAQVDGPRVFAFGQHGEHDVGAVHRGGNARYGLHAACFRSSHSLGVEVESADVMACRCQVCRHGPTHVPETDPSDYCHGESSFASCTSR